MLISLAASGKFTVAALTNNFAPPTERGKGKDAPTLQEELDHLGLGEDHYKLRQLFDHYIESAVVGKRYVCRGEPLMLRKADAL